jgi:hypothetical protein
MSGTKGRYLQFTWTVVVSSPYELSRNHNKIATGQPNTLFRIDLFGCFLVTLFRYIDSWRYFILFRRSRRVQKGRQANLLSFSRRKKGAREKTERSG